MRLQLDLPQDQVEHLEALMARTGIPTRKDLMNNALTFFEWAVNEREAGRVVASVDRDRNEIKEVIMPALEWVARRTERELQRK